MVPHPQPHPATDGDRGAEPHTSSEPDGDCNDDSDGAGYSHGDQPIPDDQTFLNIIAPGVVEDHLSVGASWKLDACNELSVAWTHAFEEDVDGSGSIPAMLGGGEANVKLAEDSVGIAWSRTF